VTEFEINKFRGISQWHGAIKARVGAGMKKHSADRRRLRYGEAGARRHPPHRQTRDLPPQITNFLSLLTWSPPPSLAPSARKRAA